MLFPSAFAQVPQPWATPRCAVSVDIPGGSVLVPTIQGLECVFGNIVAVATALAGLAVFVMLVVGGLKYLTSGGDPKATEAAGNTITHAVLGLVVIIAAYLILRFLSIFTGLPELLKFVIPGPE